VITVDQFTREEIIDLVQNVIPAKVEYYENILDEKRLRIDYSFEETKELAVFTTYCIELMNLEYWARVANTLATSTLVDIYNRSTFLEYCLMTSLKHLDNLTEELKVEITPMTLAPLEVKETLINGY
jgi:hypothetical protein